MGCLSVLLITIAISIDGFGVGLTYGLRQVKVSFSSCLLIAFCSACAMGISLGAGRALTRFISVELAGIIGGGILILIGLWQMREGWIEYLAENTVEEELLFKFEIKSLGLILQVLKEPVKADLDQSGEINGREALLLGAALNIDALGAGFGAGMTGLSVALIPVAAIGILIAISSGLYCGKKYFPILHGIKSHLLPGLILILIGSFNIIC